MLRSLRYVNIQKIIINRNNNYVNSALRLIPKSTTSCRPFSTPARQVPKKTNSLGVQTAKPWSELSTPQKGKF